MTKVRRFENLLGWQKGRELTARPEFAKDWSLRNQIENASEVQSELYLALNSRYITEPELQKAYALADDVKRLSNGLIAYLRKGASAGAPIREVEAPYITEDLEPEEPAA